MRPSFFICVALFAARVYLFSRIAKAYGEGYMKIATMAALVALAAFPALGTAQESTAVKSLAATCANCHGTDGRSITGDVPSLAGRSRQDIASSLRAFKAGTKPATVMHQLAKGYTDPQIDALAAYFAAQK
jgi:sulfide dehydrogenase cytochrome subunit